MRRTGKYTQKNISRRLVISIPCNEIPFIRERSRDRPLKRLLDSSKIRNLGFIMLVYKEGASELNDLKVAPVWTRIMYFKSRTDLIFKLLRSNFILIQHLLSIRRLKKDYAVIPRVSRWGTEMSHQYCDSGGRVVSNHWYLFRRRTRLCR